MKAFPILTFAMSAAALVLAINATIPTPPRDHVAEIVREEIAANPKLIIDAVNKFAQAEQARKAGDDERKVIEKKADIADAKGFPTLGNPDGSVTLVYFFDSNCPYCKAIDPHLKNIVAKNPDVKIIHREIPILTKTSRLAAHIDNIVWGKYPEKYAALHGLLMDHKGSLTEDDIERLLKQAVGEEQGAKLLEDIENYEGDREVHSANNRVQENLAIATDAGITGTPLVLVVEADGVIRGAVDNYEERIQTLVDKARSAKH